MGGPALLVAWVVGTLLRDRVYELIWFYFIPASVVLVVSLVWLVFFRASGRRLWWAVALVALWPLGKVLLEDFRWNEGRAVPAGALRVVHWNVARLPFGIEGVWEVLRVEAADVCLISESGDTGAVARVGAELGLTNQFYASVMTLMSRFPVSEPEPFQVAGARGWRCRVMAPQGEFLLCGVDLVSKPTMRRGPVLAGVAAWLDNRDRKMPLLVLGDFNTPRDASAFDPLRSRFVHAYEARGRGLPYSWPLPFPSYQLDHAWYDAATLDVLSYELRSSRFSDHRRQVLRVLPRDGDL